MLLFGLWWLYFLWPAGDALDKRRERAFVWGYSHYVVFAALAAVGAGLEVATEAAFEPVEASDTVVSLGVVVPVVVFLAILWVLQSILLEGPRLRGWQMCVAAAALLCVAAATSVGLPTVAAAPLVVVPIAWLVIEGIRIQHHQAANA